MPAQGVSTVVDQTQRTDVDKNQPTLVVDDAVGRLYITMQARIATRTSPGQEAGQGLGGLPDKAKPLLNGPGAGSGAVQQGMQ
jgi:hypothetical protein